MKEGKIIYRAFSPEESRDCDAVFMALEEEIRSSMEMKGLALDLEEIFLSNAFRSSLVRFLNEISSLIENAAIIGVSRGVRKIIMNATEARFYTAFDKADALEFLTGGQEGLI